MSSPLRKKLHCLSQPASVAHRCLEVNEAHLGKRKQRVLQAAADECVEEAVAGLELFYCRREAVAMA